MRKNIYEVKITNVRKRSLKEMKEDPDRPGLCSSESRFPPLYTWNAQYSSKLPDGSEDLEKAIDGLAQSIARESEKDVTVKLVIEEK